MSAHVLGHRAQRGQGLVEFALVAPLLLLLVFGVVDFGRGMSANVTVTNSSREGARMLVTSVTLNEPTVWSTAACTASTACLLNMGCPQGSATSPTQPPTGTGQASAWRQLQSAGLDLTNAHIVLTVSFFKSGNDPGTTGNTADLVVTCGGAGYSVLPTYTFKTASYFPATGDWLVFKIHYDYYAGTPVISTIFPRIGMEQTTTMVLE